MNQWLVFPARHTAAFRSMDKGSPRFWLRPDRSRLAPDRALEGEPPLPFRLSDAEIAEMRDERLVAATHYGPARQDKASNEDFALTAVMDFGEGRVFGFAALADGVSARTFWAARAARIACFGTYRAIRGLLAAGLDPGDPAKAARIRTVVARTIERLLERDFKNLEKAGAVPAEWDPDLYRRRKGDRASWYRSTLLFGVVGETGGAVGFSGDGGLRGLIVSDAAAVRNPEERRIIHAVEGKPLSSYVSFGFKPHEISMRHIGAEGRQATHVLFTSDGVDKALQGFEPNVVEEGGARCRSRYRDLPLKTRAEAFRFLETLSQRPEMVAEPDNLSMARLSWPLPSPSKSWATWRQEPFERWRMVGESGYVETNGRAANGHDAHDEKMNGRKRKPVRLAGSLS